MLDRHKRKKNFVSNRKAFSSIVGAIFAILVIVTLTGTFFVWSLDQNSRYVNAVADVNQRALDQQNESLNVTSVPGYSADIGGMVTVALSVQNDGPLTLQLASLWIQDLNGSQPYGYTVLANVILSPGESWSTPPTVQVNGAVPGDSFSGWLISARGNVFPLIVGHLKGDTGEEGTNGDDGSQWYVGTSVPPDSLGVDDDFYLNTLTNDVYRKSGGTWSYLTTLKGPEGPAGPQGPRGAGFNETGDLTLVNGTDFNATGNIHLYNGSNSYDANTALISQGIGSIAMNFKSFLVYSVNMINATSGTLTYASPAYTFSREAYTAFSVNVTNMDPTQQYLNLTARGTVNNGSLIWIFSPSSGAIKGEVWPLATVTGTTINPLYQQPLTPYISLPYNVSTRIYFGPFKPGGSNIGAGITGVNLILTGKVGTYDYGQNLPFISLIAT